MAGISQSALDKIISNNAKSFQQQSSMPQQPKRQMMQEDYYEEVDDNDYDEDPWAIPGQPSMVRKQQASDFTISESRVANSGLPDKIKNSIVNNPIDVSSANPNNISKAQEDFMSRIANGSKQIENYMNEGYSPAQKKTQQSRQPQLAQSSIDYSLIKTIVKECITEAMSQQSLLNENALKNVVLKAGKIKLYDNSGNVYEAKLEKIGNLNDKKKQ